MNKISIAYLQGNIGAVTDLLLKGEKITLTKHGKKFAMMIPIEDEKEEKRKRRSKPISFPQEQAPMITTRDMPPAEPFSFEVPAITSPESSFHRCEAPFAVCRFPGDLFEVEYTTDEGIQKKKVYLCPGHASRVRNGSEKIVRL